MLGIHLRGKIHYKLFYRNNVEYHIRPLQNQIKELEKRIEALEKRPTECTQRLRDTHRIRAYELDTYAYFN